MNDESLNYSLDIIHDQLRSKFKSDKTSRVDMNDFVNEIDVLLDAN